MIILWVFLGLLSLALLYGTIKYMIFRIHYRPVLMYHGISDKVTPDQERYIEHKGKILDIDQMKLPLGKFECQLAYLQKKGYTTFRMADYRHTTSKKTVALTFDDGYFDNFQNAFPLLKQYLATATIYLRVDKIDQANAHETREYLSWKDVETMHQAGIEFGSHTLSHTWLTEIESQEQLLDEIATSKRSIAGKLKTEITSFCYPAGMVSEAAKHLIRNHYDTAVITARGRDVSLFNRDPYLIEREAIARDDSLFLFKLKLWGIHRFIRKSWLYGMVKRRKNGKTEH